MNKAVSLALTSIMDDLELYEEQKIFTLADLTEMATFLNSLVRSARTYSFFLLQIKANWP